MNTACRHFGTYDQRTCDDCLCLYFFCPDCAAAGLIGNPRLCSGCDKIPAPAGNTKPTEPAGTGSKRRRPTKV